MTTTLSFNLRLNLRLTNDFREDILPQPEEIYCSEKVSITPFFTILYDYHSSYKLQVKRHTACTDLEQYDQGQYAKGIEEIRPLCKS